MSDIIVPGVTELRPEKGLKKFQPGDVVYFKRVKETAGPHGRFQEFRGHGFGILLGNVPERAPDPPAVLLFALMSQHGWVTFDDVAEILGGPTTEVLLAAMRKKYFIPEPPAPPTPEVPSGNS